MKVAFSVQVNNFAKIASALPGAAAKEVERSARAIEADAKMRIVQQNAVDTGNLLNSIQAEQTVSSGLQWRVGTVVEYAEFVEYGVRSKPNYPVRPYLTPSGEAEKPRFADAMKKLEAHL